MHKSESDKVMMSDISCEVSVIICTYNRSAILKDALESFFKQDGLDSTNYEIIVIDNNSSDDTSEIIQEFKEYPNFRYVFEGKQGLSNARNRGMAEARGEIIAFVDDDVLFSNDWLIEIIRGTDKWPDAIAFGGKILPKWEMPKPKWVVETGTSMMGGMIGHFEPNLPEGKLPWYVAGGNMAFRAGALRASSGFLPNLGRLGNELFGCEETELCARLRTAKNDLIYLPRMVVHHRVLPDRQEKSYYVRWVKGCAKSGALARSKHYSESDQPFRAIIMTARYETKQFIRSFASWIWLLLTFRWHALFSRKLRIISSWEYYKSEIRLIANLLRCGTIG